MGKKKTSKRNRGYIRRRIRERVSRNGETKLNTDQGKNVKRRHHIKENVPRGGSSQPNHHFLKFGCMNVDGINEASRCGVEALLQTRNYDVRYISIRVLA